MATARTSTHGWALTASDTHRLSTHGWELGTGVAPPFSVITTTNRQGILRTTTEYSFCITTDRYRVVRTSGR